MHFSSNLYITPETELSEIVMSNPDAILFLEHFDILLPYGSLTVRNVCLNHNINPQLFIAFANLYLGNDLPDNIMPEFSDLPSIISYLKSNHKYYLDEIYPKIQQCIASIKMLNDSHDIILVERFFHEYFNEVREHLEYENNIVFPYISSLCNSVLKNQSTEFTSEYSVIEYKDHHNDIEEKLTDLMNLLIKYLPQKNDQQERRKLFYYLVELDYDLKVHARIEDMVLIPLVEKMEKQ